jgi:hypothetical protein
VIEKIATSLEQMHRAYYEISFPDIPQLKGTPRCINIKPKRKGIFIHSLRSLEKSKTYPGMNQATGLKPYFALVNGTSAAALERAIGHEWVDPQEPKNNIS